MGIIINELEYFYNKGTAEEKHALKGINLQIEKGEFIGIIGHSGSGKSTLIHHLNGLKKPDKGTIYFDGEDIFDKDYSLKKLRGKVGLVFQYPEQQLFEKTVISDVEFGPKNLGMDMLEVELNSFNALKQVGISEDRLDVSPFSLSGGQKRRVAIAGVLAMKPDVLVLDEPTAGLDAKGKRDMYKLIKDLNDQGITIIMVSHSMEDMAEYTKRLIVMNDGRVEFDGSPTQVFSHYKEMEKIGLRAPQVTYVIEEIVKRGIDLPHNAITIEQAIKSILKGIEG